MEVPAWGIVLALLGLLTAAAISRQVSVIRTRLDRLEEPYRVAARRRHPSDRSAS